MLNGYSIFSLPKMFLDYSYIYSEISLYRGQYIPETEWIILSAGYLRRRILSITIFFVTEVNDELRSGNVMKNCNSD